LSRAGRGRPILPRRRHGTRQVIYIFMDVPLHLPRAETRGRRSGTILTVPFPTRRRGGPAGPWWAFNLTAPRFLCENPPVRLWISSRPFFCLVSCASERDVAMDSPTDPDSFEWVTGEQQDREGGLTGHSMASWNRTMLDSATRRPCIWVLLSGLAFGRSLKADMKTQRS
jgi:hypothetical protein